MATKKKTPAKRKPVKGTAPAKQRAAKKKAMLTEDVTPGFPEGTAVEVHSVFTGDIETSRGRAPLSPALSKGKVKKDGTFALSVDKPGIYTLAAEIGGSWRYVKVPVRG